MKKVFSNYFYVESESGSGNSLMSGWHNYFQEISYWKLGEEFSASWGERETHSFSWQEGQ